MQEGRISIKAKLLWKDLIKQITKKNCYQIRAVPNICKRLEKYHRSLGEFCIWIILSHLKKSDAALWMWFMQERQ